MYLQLITSEHCLDMKVRISMWYLLTFLDEEQNPWMYMVSPYLDFLSGIRIFFKKNLYQALEIKENYQKFTINFFKGLITF